MTDMSGCINRQIFTIGHSNHSWETFLGLLQENNITIVVDVRSSPYSRYTPHFNRDPFHEALRTAGIEYLFLGQQLGGHPEGADFYDADGRVRYDRLADSAAFQAGIGCLRTVIKSGRPALLCGEEDPAQCHRRLLIARVLGQAGIEVWHLRGDGRLQSEGELAAAEVQSQHRQLSLFDAEEMRPWKSTRSVLPKKAPKNSLPS